MNLILTCMGLLAAIYAVAPRYRQLELNLKLGLGSWLFIGALFVYAICLEFYDFLLSKFGAIISWSWPDGITPEKAINVVIIVLLVFLACRIFFAGLTRRNIKKFQKVVEELIWEKNSPVLLELLSRHLSMLFKVYHANFTLSRLRRYLAPPLWKDARWIREQTQRGLEVTFALKLRRRLKIVLRKVAAILPTYEKEEMVAREVVRLAFLSQNTVNILTNSRPYLGIEIIKKWEDRFDRENFFELYIRELLKSSDSIFYSELASTHNTLGDGRFVIPTSHKLLFYLLSDVHIAQDLGVYKPIGDHVENELNRLALDSNDPYNKPYDSDFENSDASKSPIFAAMHFFHIMVMEALYQGIDWHMWLYYFPTFVEKMARNCNLNSPLVNPTAEWPTTYHYLIYYAVSIMRNWILEIEHIPPNQNNVTLRENFGNNNGNIPECSIIAIGECVRTVVASDNLGGKFQGYILDIVFRIYFELKNLENYSEYAIVLGHSLAQGGQYVRQDDRDYKNALINYFMSERREYAFKFGETLVAELEDQILSD